MFVASDDKNKKSSFAFYYLDKIKRELLTNNVVNSWSLKDLPVTVKASQKFYFYELIKKFAKVGDFREILILLINKYILYNWFQESS